jgi:hypothetical protein
MKIYCVYGHGKETEVSNKSSMGYRETDMSVLPALLLVNYGRLVLFTTALIYLAGMQEENPNMTLVLGTVPAHHAKTLLSRNVSIPIRV